MAECWGEYQKSKLGHEIGKKDDLSGRQAWEMNTDVRLATPTIAHRELANLTPFNGSFELRAVQQHAHVRTYCLHSPKKGNDAPSYLGATSLECRDSLGHRRRR